MVTKSTKTKTSSARPGAKAAAAPKKPAAAKKSAGSSKPAGKSSGSTGRKKAEPGILTQAANAVSDLISGVVAAPAKAGLKAGASTFLQEAAGAIGTGKKVETTTAAAAKPSTKTAAKPKAAAAKSKGTSDAKSGAKNTNNKTTKTGRK